MIKRIIFDIDNTLIPSPDYKKGYSEVLKKYSITKTAEELYEVIGTYETNGNYEIYNKQDLLDHINNEFKLKLPISFIEDYLEMYNKLETYIDPEIYNTLEYLSKKYELVTLSNWFTDSQAIRLNNVGLLKHFKNVYGTDIVPMKPKKESFLSVIGDKEITECLIIGDNLKMDIEIPHELGMKTIFLNLKGISTNYKTITKISDLKEML